MTKYERTVVKDGISGDIVFCSKSNTYTEELSAVTLLISWENSTTIQPNSIDQEFIRRLKQANTYWSTGLLIEGLITTIYEMKSEGLLTEERANNLFHITNTLVRNFYKVELIHF